MENPNGAVSGNAQNTPTANVPRTRSTFNLAYHMFDTHRFGEYHPHYVEEGVKEDILPIRSSHNIMSYTLKSPLLQNITLKKDYFLVPMEAILPLNWEKFFDNPVRGDDVSVEVGPTVENFWKLVGNVFSAMTTQLGTELADSSTSEAKGLEYTLRWLVLMEYFYSNGSLMASLGCHGAPYITMSATGSPRHDFDYFFDDLISLLLGEFSTDQTITVDIDGYVYQVNMLGEPSDKLQINFRHFLSLIKDNPVFTVVSVPTGFACKSDVVSWLGGHNFVPSLAEVPFNTSRLWAYQLCCAHYYSNDHIDFVYSAELYRQLIGNYIRIFNTGWDQFSRNGVLYQYDYLSAHYLKLLLTTIASNPSPFIKLTYNSNKGSLGYLSALFAYRRSLRYQDYFTGSRAQPLAVGSTGVTVSGGSVDVVDITRNIQRQRFLNAVNRVRHNFEGYLQGIFGGDVPAPDYHNPFFLASTEDTIYGQETENTGVAQMNDSIAITTNLRSNGSKYMLEIHCDRPCVVLGLSHYDIPRVYSLSMEREFLVKDRFDMFNPFMQYIGDQPIYIQELGINPTGSSLNAIANFAYTLRHMEFKQRFNQAAGGFVSNLPGFAFLASDFRGTQANINPDWIRSVTSEFDKFYVSLNGWSNGSYFHFIVDNYNDCTGFRPMAFAPSIL